MTAAINLNRYKRLARKTSIPVVEGRLIEVVGLVLEAGGCRASIGDIYEVRSQSGGPALEAGARTATGPTPGEPWSPVVTRKPSSLLKPKVYGPAAGNSRNIFAS